MLQIVGLFNTSFNNLPPYSTYAAQNFNISSNVNLQINNLGGTTIYSDAISSIWYYLFTTFISNYNNLYNNNLLGFNYYQQNIGADGYLYLNEIAQTYFDYTFSPVSPTYDYFRNSGTYLNNLPGYSPGLIGTYMTNVLNILTGIFANFDANRGLLSMYNIIISKPQFYFDFFDNIVNEYTDIIQANPTIYYHTNYGTPEDPVLIEQTKLLDKTNEYTEPRNNAMDVAIIMQSVFDDFVDTAGIPATTNPYSQSTDPNKFALWNQYENTFNRQTELNKFNTLFSFLYPDGSSALYAQLTQIDVNYEGFILEDNVYNYMSDYVIANSFFSAFPTLLASTVQQTYINILTYLQRQLVATKGLLAFINGGSTGTSLLEILQKALNAGSPANFAWIRKLGHYLINQTWVTIGDQVIDTQYGEWMEIWHELVHINNKERGYQILIGDVPENYTFNTTVKNTYEMMIPLQFWFCRNSGASLPLIALNNSDVRVYFDFKNFNDVCYYDSLTQFVKTPKLKCKLIGEYIYIDDDERNNLAKSKLEYLIDYLQNNGDMLLTGNNLYNNNTSITNTILNKMYFQNPCKEFFWVLQRQNFVDGSLPNGQKLWYVYSYDENQTINPIDQARIKFTGRVREDYKDAAFYNYIQPFERHYNSPPAGINIYSFSLAPEILQPSGSANMSRIDDSSIEIKLIGQATTDLTNNAVVLRWTIYALGYNILRIFSGMAGLVFNV